LQRRTDSTMIVTGSKRRVCARPSDSLEVMAGVEVAFKYL
jgi:hypothetical protein